MGMSIQRRLNKWQFRVVWSEMKTEGKVVLIGNIYIAPGNENQLHHLDNELEQHKEKSILLVKGFQ